jgi:hypothetical protein
MIFILITFITQVTAIYNIIPITITTIIFPSPFNTNIIEHLQIFTIWMKPFSLMIMCFLIIEILLIQVIMYDINFQLYNFHLYEILAFLKQVTHSLFSVIPNISTSILR